MGYVKNTWVDQDVERPKTYEVTTNQDGSITLTDSFGNVTELGTPVNAVNMNHIEDGLARTDLTKYDASVTYMKDEWVTGTVNNVKTIYKSLVDNNTGNALSDTTKWEEAGLLPIATTSTLGGVIIGDGIEVASDGTISASGKANIDLTNLTSKGNAKFQFDAFSINNGTVSNGNNATLHVPAGATVSVEEQFIPEPFTSSSDNGAMGGAKFGVTASGTWSSPYDPWRVMQSGDGGAFDAWISTTSPETFDIYNPDAIKITNINIRNFVQGAYSITEGTVSGSNNYSSWTQIKSFTNSNVTGGKTWDIDLSSNTNSYKYYRINITKGNPNSIGIQRMKITATKVVSVSSSTSLICDPCTITTADSRTAEFSGESVLDCSSLNDGTYFVFKNFYTGVLTVASSLSMQKTAPTSPSSDDLWLDVSEYPICLKVYNGSSWDINNDIVYIGNVTVSSGSISSVTNADFNRKEGGSGDVTGYVNGSDWYRVYPADSTGYKWCEQGGTIEANVGSTGSVVFLKQYRNTNGLGVVATSQHTNYSGYYALTALSATGFSWSKSATASIIYWRAQGYID